MKRNEDGDLVCAVCLQPFEKGAHTMVIKGVEVGDYETRECVCAYFYTHKGYTEGIEDAKSMGLI